MSRWLRKTTQEGGVKKFVIGLQKWKEGRRLGTNEKDLSDGIRYGSKKEKKVYRDSETLAIVCIIVAGAVIYFAVCLQTDVRRFNCISGL